MQRDQGLGHGRLPVRRARDRGAARGAPTTRARSRSRRRASTTCKGIDVEFPLGKFVCVTGVSGSGKSTLVNEIVYKSLANRLNQVRTKPGEHDAVEGIEASTR